MNIHVRYIALMTTSMFLLWMIGGVAIGSLNGVSVEALDQVARSIGPKFVVCLLNVLIMAWFVTRADLTGFRLAFRVFFLLFGIVFLFRNLEIFFFNVSASMPFMNIAVDTGAGALAALGVAVLAKNYRNALGSVRARGMWVDPSRNVTKLLTLAVLYMVIHSLLEYYVAWKSEDVRVFYSRSAELLPLDAYLWESLRDNYALPVYLILRGLIWAGFGYAAIVALGQARALERILLVGLILGVGVASPLFVPDAVMPVEVRTAHLLELSAGNFAFGVLVALFFRPRARP